MTRCHWILIGLLLATAGCGPAESAANGATARLHTRPLVVSPPSPTAVSERPASSAQSESAASPAPATTAPFQAPFPHRNNPFRIPAMEIGSQPSEFTSADGLELKGFMQREGVPIALFSAAGKVVRLVEGDRWSNAEVVAIDPPRVTLQRGNHRWTLRLFEGSNEP